MQWAIDSCLGPKGLLTKILEKEGRLPDGGVPIRPGALQALLANLRNNRGLAARLAHVLHALPPPPALAGPAAAPAAAAGHGTPAAAAAAAPAAVGLATAVAHGLQGQPALSYHPSAHGGAAAAALGAHVGMPHSQPLVQPQAPAASLGAMPAAAAAAAPMAVLGSVAVVFQPPRDPPSAPQRLGPSRMLRCHAASPPRPQMQRNLRKGSLLRHSGSPSSLQGP